MPAAWECPDCRAQYAVRLSGCPRCLAFPRPAPTEEEQMPKITVFGGPSNFRADWSDGAPEVAEAPVEGSESFPGTSSSASSPTSADRTSSSEPCAPGPAPTTEPLSKQDMTESSTAAPTDGSTPATGAPDRPPAEGYDARTVVELRVLLKDRGLAASGSKADMVQRLADADNDTQESGA